MRRYCKQGQFRESVPPRRPCGLFSIRRSTAVYTSSKPIDRNVSQGLSDSEASALLITFYTAWIALRDTACLQKGESILIHAGAGGTGQAAVPVAKYLRAEGFVTVGSNQKKDLGKVFYSLPDDRIFYSRDTTFAQGVMGTTGGRGIDVCLVSLSGEGLHAS